MMSRSIGDAEAGEIVLGEPEVRQVSIPTTGARLILASDGLWDAVSPKTVIHQVSAGCTGHLTTSGDTSPCSAASAVYTCSLRHQPRKVLTLCLCTVVRRTAHP